MLIIHTECMHYSQKQIKLLMVHTYSELKNLK